jgi:NADPH2:quinone reductase
MAVPATTRAVQFSRPGGVEVIEHNDVPVPSPPEGHVLVRNRFSGVNYIDTYFRSGLYAPPAFPMTFGREAASEVVAAHPSVTGAFAAPGTRVVYMNPGTYTAYSAVPAHKLCLVPDGVALHLAAAVMLQGLTAVTMIRESAAVQPGQWTLVWAAAGGCGILLVQILRNLGAKVIGVASTEDKCALARKYGAEWTLLSDDDVAAKVMEITGGHGVDAIFDGVGKATFQADLDMVARNGHLVSFGVASGPVPPVSTSQLADKNVKLVRPVVTNYIQERKNLEHYTNELMEMILSKKIDILIHKVYNLADAASAHADIESRKTTGKLLIKCD